MEVYIGLDVSLATTAICVLGEKGKIVTEAQVASAPDRWSRSCTNCRTTSRRSASKQARCLIGCTRG